MIDFTQFVEPQHLIVKIKWLGESGFKDVDLADVKEEHYFLPLTEDGTSYLWSIPFLPTDPRACMVKWRCLVELCPLLVETATLQ
jgi:hypothetical protein